jgi:hypothetical protein
MFQEKEIPLKACNGKIDCSFEEFQTSLTEITDNCDVPSLCKLKQVE